MAPRIVVGVLAAISTFAAYGASSPDQEVVTAVLTHFTARDDASLGSDGVVLLAPTTEKWTDQLMRGFSLRRGNDTCPISDELYDRLIEVNTTPMPSQALVSKSDKWRIATQSELKPGTFGFTYKTDSGSRARTLAGVVRPAYSSTGDTAFVMFFFRWSMHSAIAQYVVNRGPSEWRVKCSQLRFYP